MGRTADDTSLRALLEQQRVLAEFGAFALEAEALNPILEQACRLVGRVLETDLAKVVELLPDGKTMLVRAGVGWKRGVVGDVTVSADDNSPEGLTLKEGAVISPNIEEERRFAYHEFLKQHGVKAFVNVLILSGKGRRPFGVLQVDSRRPRCFAQSDIEFLRGYANLLGAAIERLRGVEELRAALRDKELLVNELNHRVKNTLTTVQSIVVQSLRNAATTLQAKDAIEARLLALARAHDVLTRENWQTADLHEVIARAVEPYRGVAERRIHLKGPAMRVSPRMALVIAMTLQELATNAVKYGSLSNDVGEVLVTWEMNAAGGARRLAVRWEELGGPAVREPERRGFGTRLIERSLTQDLNGQARIEFAPTGVVCTFDNPL